MRPLAALLIRGSRMGLASVLFAAGCLLAAVAAADAPAAAEAVPIWDGAMLPGAATELIVRVDVPAAGTLAIEAGAPAGRLDTLRAPRQYRLVSHATGTGTYETRIPLPGLDDPRVRVWVTFDGAPLAVRDLALSPVPAVSKVIAIAADPSESSSSAPAAWPPDPAAIRLYVNAEDLPHYPDSYAIVDLLVMSRAVLEALDAEQLAALEQFVAGCGRLLLHHSSAATAAAIEQAAGCGGRFVAESGSDVAAAAAALLGDAPPALPQPTDLLALVPAASAPLRVFGLLFGYVALMVVVLARRTPPAWVLALPAAVCALAASSWSGALPDRRWASWAELESGSGAGRFVALLALTGNGLGPVSVALPPLASLPRPLGAEQPPTLHYRAYGRVDLELDSRLLDRQLVAFAGAWRKPPGVELAMDGANPAVVNTGERTVMHAMLAWRGDKYLVPALAPGQRWQPDDAARAPWRRGPAESMFRQRAFSARAAVLLPAAPPGRAEVGRGYLMVRL